MSPLNAEHSSARDDVSFVLVKQPASADLDALFPTTPWGEPWDRVLTKELPDRHFDVVLPAAAVASAVLNGHYSVGLVCTTEEELRACHRSLANLRGVRSMTVLFRPSPVSILDCRRRGRRTLILLRAARSGEVVNRDMVGLEAEGRGLGEGAIHAVLGRPLVYDLAAGSSLDLGVVA